MGDFVTELQDFFRHRLWQDEGRGPGSFWPLKCLRVLVLAGRGLIRNQSLVRSSSLAYATILGFIPLFALLFAILQAIGVPRLIATYTLEHLAPGSRQFATQILQYIEVHPGDLPGGLRGGGAAPGSGHRHDQRGEGLQQNLAGLPDPPLEPQGQRLPQHLPDLSHPDGRGPDVFHLLLGIQHVIQILSGIMPAIFFTATRWLVSLGLLWFAFIFIYLVMPNTRVNFWSAVLGGVIGGTVWQVAQWIFTAIQGGAAYYNAIYGALYNLLFLFIWLFWCWLILLFGTEIAFAHQNLDWPHPASSGAHRRRRSRWTNIFVWPRW